MIVFSQHHRNLYLARAQAGFIDHDFLIRHAWDQVIDRLHDIKRSFTSPAVIGPRGTQYAMDRLMQTNKVEPPFTTVNIQDEIINANPEVFDLVLSVFDLHTINDLPGFLIQIRHLLKEDGVFIAAMPGGETLFELRQVLTQAELNLRGGISPRVFPFADKQQMGALMQRAGYALPVVDSDIIRVEYSGLIKLLHDLRGMGEGNAIKARDHKTPPRLLFPMAETLYREQFPAPEDRIEATFEIIYLIGWAPAASQQKPLKPGSATIRLADALSTQEMGTGDIITE